MAKRLRKITPEMQEKRIKEGRGQGIGKEYKPWLTIQDVSSLGRECRTHGIKIDRQHELLSDNERNYFYIIEYSDCVKDIREQFPLLPLEQTVDLANRLGIKHSQDMVTKTPLVMTTDFLVSVEINGEIKTLARTIKEKKDLTKRQIEKFEVERQYWKMKGVDWGIVTEYEINTVASKNISIIRPFHTLEDIDSFENFTKAQVGRLVESFAIDIIGKKVVIRNVAETFDIENMLPPGTGLSIYKYLLANKILKMDLLVPLDVDHLQLIENYIGREGNERVSV